MPAIRRRTWLGIVLSWSVALAPVLVPEHVHEGDALGPGSMVHRHLAPHQQASPHRTPSLDHPDDDHVVWLTPAWLQMPAFEPPDAATAHTANPVSLADSARWSSLVLDHAAPPHGPPRSAARLRAPPDPA